MRPIDLTPPEMRQGAHAPMRTGPLPYILLGALVAVLAGVALLVMTGNQISEREDEVAQLKREDAAAKVEARRLAPYVQFQSLHEQRVATISSLADSRFDWERVMRELSLVLPHDVWLTQLDAAASSISAGDEGGSGGLSGSVVGPSLELGGCAAGQESVAGFVTALKDIDGVTRVGIASSELPSKEEGEATSSSSESGGDGGCQTRKFIVKFSILVAFDAAPVPITAEGEGTATAAETAETTASQTESESTESSESE
jgi:Tfp pilus assembly protein PilN